MQKESDAEIGASGDAAAVNKTSKGDSTGLMLSRHYMGIYTNEVSGLPQLNLISLAATQSTGFRSFKMQLWGLYCGAAAGEHVQRVDSSCSAGASEGIVRN